MTKAEHMINCVLNGWEVVGMDPSAYPQTEEFKAKFSGHNKLDLRKTREKISGFLLDLSLQYGASAIHGVA